MATQTSKRKQRAKELYAKMKNIRVAFRRHWTIYGEIAVKFEEEELFKELGFESMKACLKSLPDACYSTVAEAMAVIKSLPEINPVEMAQYPKENLKILSKVPESKRTQAKILEAAREMKSADFRAFVNEKYKTALDKKTRYFIDCEDSQVTIYDGAVAKMQEIGEAQGEKLTKADAWEFMAAAFLQKMQDVKPEAVKLSLRKRAINLEEA